jgi:GT2 family glycosyltransferase
MKEPLVNIIIITTNQFTFIGDCIRSLSKCSYKNIKIYCIDNNSNKEDYQIFYGQFKHIKHISFFRLNRNMGFAGACNFGIRKVKSGYIVFLNDDVIVTKNWLSPIISFMEKHPEVGACQPKILNMVHKDHFDYAGGAGGLMDVYGYPFCRGRIFYTLEKDMGQYNDPIDLVWCSGACLVTKKEVLDTIGLFDEIFFIYQEEADLCWRMHLYNYRMVYLPTSTIYHFGSATMKNGTFKKTLLHHRNTLILLLKNYTYKELLRYLPFRVVLDFVCFWYYFIGQGIFINAVAVVSAYIQLIYLFPAILERRKHAAFRIQNVNKKPYPLYRSSIIVKYFVFNKKTVKALV